MATNCSIIIHDAFYNFVLLPCHGYVSYSFHLKAAILVGINKEDINRNTTDTELECLSKPVCIKVGNTFFLNNHPRNVCFPYLGEGYSGVKLNEIDREK